MSQNNSSALESSFETATGIIPYTLTNDYMFKVVLQENEEILKSLVASCLSIPLSEIKHIEPTNPFIPGAAIDDKSFILDLKIDLNNNTIIDLEMQVNNLGNWPERSVSYLARAYDNLTKGSNYEDVKTAYHIGFLDYTLFEDYPEFFAKYQLLNIKNHNLYTSKFNLFVVDLTQTKLATDEDIENGLYYWAKLFKAKTWEELRMIAEENKTLQSTSQILFKYNNDENMKEYCRRREDAIAWETSAKNKIEKLTSENQALQTALSEALAQIARLESQE